MHLLPSSLQTGKSTEGNLSDQSGDSAFPFSPFFPWMPDRYWMKKSLIGTHSKRSSLDLFMFLPQESQQEYKWSITEINVSSFVPRSFSAFETAKLNASSFSRLWLPACSSTSRRTSWSGTSSRWAPLSPRSRKSDPKSSPRPKE